MPFTPGRKKTGGRKPGTPNRTTAQLRDLLTATLEDELLRLPELLEALEPAKRIEALIRMLPYRLPRVQGEADGMKNYEPDSPPTWIDSSPLAGDSAIK